MDKPLQPIRIDLSEKDKESNETRPTLIRNEKSTAVVNTVIATISAIRPGLTIVSVPDESLLPHVLFSFITLARKMGSELGIPMPETESVTSVHSGSPRDLDAVERFATANPNNNNWAPHVIKTFAAHHKLDWTSPEGQQLWQPIIEEAKGSVIMDLVIHGPITPAVSQGLIRIGNESKKADVCVTLIVACSGGLQKSQLSYLCDEYIEVTQCESDVGVEIAFAIDCVGIRDLNSLGIGKTMCSIKQKKTDGLFWRRYAPFISASHETRIMWYLRGQGNTLEEIGRLVKVNRSTVLRRLQGLPASHSVDWGPNWLDRNLG